MKTPKDEDIVDLNGPPSKKMKQARLPFKLLTPKVADTKCIEEITDKDEAQKEKSCEDGMTDKKAKENTKTDEVIVLEDSVEFSDKFKDKIETEKVPIRSSPRKRAISVSPPKKVARKRQKTSKNDISVSDNSSTQQQDSKSTLASPEKASKTRNLRNESSKEAERKEDCDKVLKSQNKDIKLSADKKLKKESPKKKIGKRIVLTSQDGDSKSSTSKSPSKAQKRKESPKKKLEKEEEEDDEKSAPLENGDGDDNMKATAVVGPNKQRRLRKQSTIKNEVKKNDESEEKNMSRKSSTSPQKSRSSGNESPRTKEEDGKKPGESTPQNGGATPQDGGSPSQDSKATTPASVDKTPKSRKLTPSQLEKQNESAKKKAEKEQKLLEKERLRKEKEDQLNKLKEEKLKMKLDKEEQKKRERDEKEELKKKEKEEKEKKRLAEIELKNEVKRLKEEERKKQNEAKDEEKRAREEEKRKRDEAKEEEKRKREAEKRKAAEAFASFFKAKEANAGDEADMEMEVDYVNRTAAEEKFMPFEVKGDMRLSNVCRRTLDPAAKSKLDEKLQSQNADISDLYIKLLKTKTHLPLTGEKTWPTVDETDDDVIIIEAEVNEENDFENSGKEVHKEKKTNRYKAKLLQFDENRRPPYWGTWRKKSTNIGPRRPFCLDKTIFEYDADSDDEWEEEEPGESLRGSDDENEKESEDEYEVDNMVFVPHGYLSDEEMQDELEDCSREAQKAKLQLLEIEFQAEMNQKTEKLKPRLIGCVWFENSVSDPSAVGSRIAEMLLSRRMVLFDSDMALPIEANFRQSSMESSSTSSPVTSSPLVEQVGRKSKFPESAIPMLIKLVHGNRNKLNFLVREFSSYLTKNCTSTLDVPSMNCIRHKIRHMAKWMPFLAEDSSTCPLAGKMCWYVGKDVREKYELLLNDSELVTDPWIYILQAPRKNVLPLVIDQPITEQSPKSASITKFTKKMTEEERKKQLLQMTADSSPTSASSPSTVVSKKTPLCKPSNLLAAFVSLKSNSTTPTKSSQQSNIDDNDIIVISPDKTEQDMKDSGDKGSNSTKSLSNKNVECGGTKNPVVKKRVQLTTLSTFGVNSIVKKSESVEKTSESVEKTSSVSKGNEDEKSPVSKDKDEKSSAVTDSLAVESPRESPEAFLGFQVIDLTSKSESSSKIPSKDPTKTPKSETRGKRTSIASFLTKGTRATSAKKLFDRKQTTNQGEGSPNIKSLCVATRDDEDFASLKVNNFTSEKSSESENVSSNELLVPLDESKTSATSLEDSKTSAAVSVDCGMSSSDQKDSKTSAGVLNESETSSRNQDLVPKTCSEPSRIATSLESSKPVVEVMDQDSTNAVAASTSNSKALKHIISDDVGMDTSSQNESIQERKVCSVPSSPSQTPPKKRAKLTTLSPPKWRVKLSKPQLPAKNLKDDDDEVIVID